MKPAGQVHAEDRGSWLQHLVAWGAALRTARMARRDAADAVLRRQGETLRTLMRRFAATEFGREQGLSPGMSYARFRSRVAPRVYEDLVPAIERMKAGAADVLWPGRCAHYAVSSGTTAGRTKYLPVTREMLGHFRMTGLDTLCSHARRAGGTSVFRGRHLFLGGSTALSPLPGADGFRAWGGDLSGITALNLPRWVERHLYEPGRDIAQMTDWPAKLRAMAERTIPRRLTLLAGIPSWLLIFAAEVRAQTGRETLKEVWPGLECLVHGGVPLGPFAAELRAVLGPGVHLHEVYPASEGFIAVQDDEPEAGLRLLTSAGIFYEFLPMAAFDPGRLGRLADEVRPLAEVETGIDYALVMTTPGGLCRYVIGDVVRFLSLAPPRLIYVGRTALQLSAFGEHVIEKELTDAITRVAVRHGIAVANFHVAPRFADRERGEMRGRHEWWIELRGGGAAVPAALFLEQDLDRELQHLNEDYEAKRRGGGLDLPQVHLLPAGTFERWLRARGKWGGQNKMPRCRSDRAVADELQRLAPAGVPDCS